jgi:type VI secretion system protein ImpG
MKDLLPHFERELAFLRSRAAEFAREYPKIAGRLQVSGDVGDDPHVERLIESFAFLAARIHKRLDDDFPLFTEALLDVLYPHYRRPFPSCAIARFDPGASAAQMSRGITVSRGTMLRSRLVEGTACRFRTAYDCAVLPVRVAAAAYRSVLRPPEGTRMPRDAGGFLSIRLELASPLVRWGGLGVDRLRLYIDGEGSQVAAIREALFGRVVAVLVEEEPSSPWTAAPQALPLAVGFADEEALLDFDARQHPAYRLLTEYFAFPDKFHFVDLPLPGAVLGSAGQAVTLHLAMTPVRQDSDDARMLETLGPANLLTGCTPVVNLFEQAADPVRVTHATASCPVLPDGRRAHAYEVHSIESVRHVQQTPQGEKVRELPSFFSLRHDDLQADAEGAGRYWYVHRDESLEQASPGHETQIAFVDVDFDPAEPRVDTLSIRVKATNRDLPQQLRIGQDDGDLRAETGPLVHAIRLLRRPTASLRFPGGRGVLWRLVSHLSVNHLSLSGGGIDALKEMLRLYDLPRSPAHRRMIDALAAVEYRPSTACLPGNPFPVFVHGMEVRLTLDEEGFVGTGLRLFAQVFEHYLALQAHINSYTQLRLVSARTHEELIACTRRSGCGPLV